MNPAFRPDLMPSAVSQILEYVEQKKWSDVIHLAGGEPIFSPPKAVLSGLESESIGTWSKYTPFRGLPTLLSSIQMKLSEVNNIDVSEGSIIVTPGGAGGLFSAIATALRPRRSVVLVMDPCWEHYPRIIQAAGGVPVSFDSEFIAGHNYPDFEHVTRLCQSGTVSAVLINNPVNPTGSLFTVREIERLSEICRRYDVVLISDEEYETFVNIDRSHVSAVAVDDAAVSLFSMSKSFSLTGLRMGYAVAPPSFVDGLKRFGLYSYMYTSSPAQVLAERCLNDPDLAGYLSNVQSSYRRNATLFAASLSSNGIPCDVPEAGLYVFPKIPRKPLESTAARQILDLCHVACVPGEVAGSGLAGRVRFFIGRPEEELREAALRITDAFSGNAA